MSFDEMMMLRDFAMFTLDFIMEKMGMPALDEETLLELGTECVELYANSVEDDEDDEDDEDVELFDTLTTAFEALINGDKKGV